jgi:twitching motility protein PilT
VAVHDILVVSSAVANLIREGKTFQIPSIMQTSKREGMQVMDQQLSELVRTGVVAGATAWEYANDKALFSQYAPTDTGALTPAQTGGTPAAPTASGMAKPNLPGLKKTGS